jgi:ferredoxin
MFVESAVCSSCDVRIRQGFDFGFQQKSASSLQLRTPLSPPVHVSLELFPNISDVAAAAIDFLRQR